MDAWARRPAYRPPALPSSLPRRDLTRDRRFDVPSAKALGPTAFRAAAAPAFPVKPRIVSSAHGPIRHLMLWFGAHSAETFGYEDTFADLLRELPADTAVTLVAHPDVVERAERVAGLRNRVRVITAPDWLAFSVWAEDACVVIEDVGVEPPVTFLLEPAEFSRYGDQVVAELVAQPTPIQTAQVPLHFQGGNILIGDTFVFIGRDYLDESVAAINRTRSVEGFPYSGSGEEQEAFVRDLFRRTFDPEREVHFLTATPTDRPGNRIVERDGAAWLEDRSAGRGRRQPIFHIDMFVTLAGRARDGEPYRVLVGDPGAADTLLGWGPVEHSLQQEYDDIAAQVTELGFDVIRMPLPYLPVIEPGRDVVESPGGPVPVAGRITWYHPTACNCLVQIDGNLRDVWLPTYAHGAFAEELAPVDEACADTWRRLGFTVHQLGDFHPFASRMGALHCITKYLAR